MHNMERGKEPSGEVLAVRPVRPAYQQVADELADLIRTGRLKTGVRLPIESEIATSFGVSRSTVREALRVMTAQNLVVTRRGVKGGSFVVVPEPDQISSYLETSFGLLSRAEALSVDQLLEVRTVLEVPAAGFAASRRTDEIVQAIAKTLLEADGAIGANHFSRNWAFHKAVLEATGNPLLHVITQPLFGVLRNRFLRDAAPPGFWPQVTAEHHRILETISAGDETAAKHEMWEHLVHLRETYIAIDRHRSTSD